MQGILHKIRVILFFVGILSCSQLYAYNIDSLMSVIGQVSFDEQHKKVEAEISRLRDINPEGGVELGNYWINILNEKQASDKVAYTISLTAANYYRLGNYPANLQYLQTARSLYKANNNLHGEACSIRDMGFTYRKMGENQEAYHYLELSIRIFEKIGDYNELSTTYNYMGNLIEEWKKDFTTAEILYRKSIACAEKINNEESISYSLEFIGIVKSELGEKDSSVYYLNKSMEIRKRLNLTMPLALSYTNLAEVLDRNGDYKGAHLYYNKALQISSAIQFHDLTNFIYGNLSKIHRKRGNLDSAITYMELQNALQDSLFNLQKTKEFAEIKEKYESELKEEKIISLNNKIELNHQKDRNRVYLFVTIISILGFLILSGAIVGIVIYNSNQKKTAKEKIEQERLRNKMIIEAEEKERTRIAKDLHDSLGQMLAALKMNLNSLSNSNTGNGQFTKTTQILDDTITEMRSISHAMMPESLVKNGLAQALMDISNHVETNQTKVNVNVTNWKGWTSTGEYVLYRIVQELLNNTLKHAEAKIVNIELNQFDDEINLIYEDDGKGFDFNSTKSDGIGLQNMNNRISSINGHIDFDSKPGVGTTAIISVSLKEKV
jgi:two-component system NarL family sensor kinase